VLAPANGQRPGGETSTTSNVRKTVPSHNPKVSFPPTTFRQQRHGLPLRPFLLHYTIQHAFIHQDVALGVTCDHRPGSGQGGHVPEGKLVLLCMFSSRGALSAPPPSRGRGPGPRRQFPRAPGPARPPRREHSALEARARRVFLRVSVSEPKKRPVNPANPRKCWRHHFSFLFWSRACPRRNPIQGSQPRKCVRHARSAQELRSSLDLLSLSLSLSCPRSLWKHGFASTYTVPCRSGFDLDHVVQRRTLFSQLGGNAVNHTRLPAQQLSCTELHAAAVPQQEP